MACLSCSSRCAGPALTAILSHAAHYWQVLCALASGGSSRRTWLLDAGILPLLHRLTMERARDVAGGRGTDWLYSKECRCSLVQTFDGGGRVTILLKSVALLKNVLTAAPPCSAPVTRAELPSSAGAYVEEGIPLCIQRQAVRLLAMLASDNAGAAAVQDAGWIPWLQDLAVSTDLKLSSCASRALLHIESAAAAQRPGLTKLALPLHAVPAPLLPLEQQGAAAAAAAAGAGQAAGDAVRPPSPVVAEAAEMLGEARQKMAQVRGASDVADSLLVSCLCCMLASNACVQTLGRCGARRPRGGPSHAPDPPSLLLSLLGRCGGGWTGSWMLCGLRCRSSSGWSCRWAHKF